MFMINFICCIYFTYNFNISKNGIHIFKTKVTRMSATKPKTYSEAEVKQAEDLMTDLPNITDLDKLRDSYAKNSSVLELPLNGTTLKDMFHARAQELKGE